MSKPNPKEEISAWATYALATITHLERCKQILWEDWSNCRDMHHELDTHIAHHEALQAIDITIEIVRKLKEEEDEANLENV